MQRIIGFLSLITVSVWLAVFSIDNNLHIIACDVGQGDAILIQKLNTQILIDSGSNNKVLDCLGRHMPFWDREIELAILTHVDKDHSGGFPDVMRAYKVENFLTNDLNNPLFSTQTAGVLQNIVGGSGTHVIYPQLGIVLRVGMIQLDILWPEATIPNSNTNDTSIVTLLRYAQFKALFMGDLELNISEDLFEKEKIGPVDYIKISHHGSRNGTSQRLLDLLQPKIAIISVGKNSYGHPDQKILQILNDTKVKILRTDQEGDVEILVNDSGLVLE